ncbi:hypothetical protein LSA84_002892 [Listeria monocytogenes]|nr:hypothetical protein [Listeria monocytogenes]
MTHRDRAVKDTPYSWHNEVGSYVCYTTFQTINKNRKAYSFAFVMRVFVDALSRGCVLFERHREVFSVSPVPLRYPTFGYFVADSRAGQARCSLSYPVESLDPHTKEIIIHGKINRQER